jgi:electron transfer flavoprotein beta subunit
MSKTNLKIAVLVSPARHPVSGRALRSVSDAAAFELACKLAPANRLTLLCAGLASKDSLQEYLGLGAPEIEVLTVADAGDALPALSARLQGYDIVLCGARSDGQFASGMLPYLLAEDLGMPLVQDVLDAEEQQGTLVLRQFLPKGQRRRLEVPVPAVLAVHARAPQTRQYAYARACAGRINYVAGGPSAQSAQPSSPPQPSLLWRYEPATRRPQPLKAKVAQSGHSRMLGAIGGDAGARGGQIVTQGSIEQKSQILLDYLREHRLVDF